MPRSQWKHGCHVLVGIPADHVWECRRVPWLGLARLNQRHDVRRILGSF